MPAAPATTAAQSALALPPREAAITSSAACQGWKAAGEVAEAAELDALVPLISAYVATPYFGELPPEVLGAAVMHDYFEVSDEEPEDAVISASA